MAEDTKIQWATHTMNPWRGCTKVSKGCKLCYAETMSHRNPGVLGVWGPNGTRVVAAESQWKLPLKWDREAKAKGERHRVFCASLADVFEDWHGPMVDSHGRKLDHSGVWQFVGNPSYDPLSLSAVRMRLGELIRRTPHLDWLLLTKRPQNVVRMAEDHMFGVDDDDKLAWPDNCWIGTSVEDQETADARIPHLLDVPAKVRFLSCEPLLGPVDLSYHFGVADRHGEPSGPRCNPDGSPAINWAIVGCESGAGRRRMASEWAESLVQQCEEAGVSCFVKQVEMHGKVCGDFDDFPQPLRVRRFPLKINGDRP